MKRMTVAEYKKEARVCGSRRSSRFQDNDTLRTAYKSALDVLHDLQSDSGTLFLGSAPFRAQVQLLADIRGDQTNVQKGCEDALNGIAWKDDKQNRFLSDPPAWSKGLD